MAWTEERKQEARERIKKLRAEGKLKRKPKKAKPHKETKVAKPYVPAKEANPADEIVEFFVNLAPNAETLSVNGQAYWHGHTYKVPQSLAWTLNEMAGNTWKHEAQVHGDNENQYRRAGAYRTFSNRRRLSGR